MKFKALVLTKSADKSVPSTIEVTELNSTQLPEGNVTVKIDYSTLNYKDALVLTQKAPIARISPLVLGIDGVGTVVESVDNRYAIGSKVILNGWGVGERYWGCLSQYAKLDADWLIPLPDQLSEWDAMVIGTGGYTAALSVLKLVKAGVKPEDGPILVTGSTGGVGSFAVALLSKLGYHVVASTGKPAQSEYLKKLGAAEILDRHTLTSPDKPLQKEIWAGAIDTVGSNTLVNVCAQMRYNGVVTACGLAQGMDFPASVAPFILRGITLIGVDSVMASYQVRVEAWDFLAKNINKDTLGSIGKTIGLNECIQTGQEIINGNAVGRYVVDVNR